MPIKKNKKIKNKIIILSIIILLIFLVIFSFSAKQNITEVVLIS